ncbi:hypothetical protein QTG54_010480 [Skeletonema marinoi]|uniref:Uncharacterized protein n=1 Tax=Skeletonema marinoi TaxID=267567 RepID=A0A7S0XNZ1_9STRA|nr:hypothetical protein QTG54_010480 [Skeletonema marinoi]|mmetsp:Transcript_652/g.1236  ORF Transcript_652/g.1236 Transcript_652/m.1236 type:complete len:197 (+) Transcript_652:97-687(+)
MTTKPLLICLSTASIGGFLELTTASKFTSSHHQSQLTAITPCILIGTGLWTLAHGFTVGKARIKYATLAKKDGETNVDERYLLPNLYAQGTSKHVRAFNCIQRSHQQIFETYTTVVLSGVMGAISFPICTAVSTFVYAVGRYQLSTGYAEAAEEGGDASKRYKYPLAKFMWYGFLCNVLLGMGSCGLIVGGKKTVG